MFCTISGTSAPKYKDSKVLRIEDYESFESSSYEKKHYKLAMKNSAFGFPSQIDNENVNPKAFFL